MYPASDANSMISTFGVEHTGHVLEAGLEDISDVLSDDTPFLEADVPAKPFGLLLRCFK